MTDAERLAEAFRGSGLLRGLDHPPGDVASAYDLQAAVRQAIGGAIAGWKLAQTTTGAQEPLGLDAPTVAPLLDGMVVPADTVFASRRFYLPEAEAEIAIELREAIDRPVTADDVGAVAAGFRLAIELADTRYADKPTMGIHAVIADMNSGGALVVGPLQDIALLDDAQKASIAVHLGDGSVVAELPAEARPDPLAMVAFLSGFVAARGHTLPAGTIITTGTNTKPTRTAPGLVSAEFVGIGRVACRLSEPRQAR